MAAYRRVYDSRHLQADCQQPGSAMEPYARQSSIGYLYLFSELIRAIKQLLVMLCAGFSLQTAMPGSRLDSASRPPVHRIVAVWRGC